MCNCYKFKTKYYTIALKEQLNLCFRLLDRRDFYQRLIFGPAIDSLAFFIDLSKLINSVPSSLTDGCAEVSWVKWKGIKYKINFCVVLSSELDDSKHSFVWCII